VQLERACVGERWDGAGCLGLLGHWPCLGQRLIHSTTVGEETQAFGGDAESEFGDAAALAEIEPLPAQG
jgi:hypothetical protein